MYKENKHHVYLFDLREKRERNLKEGREQSKPEAPLHQHWEQAERLSDLVSHVTRWDAES